VLGCEYAALTNNGTSSLKAAICAGVCVVREIAPAMIDREISKGEIIVPAFSFNATLNAVLQLGARVKVVDIAPDNFGINGDQVEAALSSETIGVVPVDLYGQPAETRSLYPLLKKNGIAMIRDSAQAHGATIEEQSLTEHGDSVSLSFYATKNINSGEGGAVLTSNQRLDGIVRMYRNQGMSERYKYEMIGDNLRMSDLHAAILVTQLGQIAAYKKIRQSHAELLTNYLKDVEGITTPGIREGMDHVFHQYTILVEPEFGMRRDQLAEALSKKGIGTGVYYPKVMTEHETYQNHPRISVGQIDTAKEVAKKALSLPIHTKLSQGDIGRVAEAIIEEQD
jgi:perosamine synthetase